MVTQEWISTGIWQVSRNILFSIKCLAVDNNVSCWWVALWTGFSVLFLFLPHTNIALVSTRKIFHCFKFVTTKLWNCVVNFPTDTYRYFGLKLNDDKNYMTYRYLYIWWCSFICPSSEDNRVLLWDVRSSKGSLMSLDQFNGQEVPTFLSGEVFENYYFVLNFSHCC